MTLSAYVVIGLIMGVVFGFALEKGRVFEPGVIIGQMQFRTFTMLKMFLTATATGLVVLAIMNGVYGFALHPKATFVLANALGGGILGVGIVLAGACPGTLLAQIGAGYKDAWFALAGAIAGTMAFGYIQPVIKPYLYGDGLGKLRLDVLMGVPFWAMALIFAAVLVAGLVALERYRPWYKDIGCDVDGIPNA